MSAECPISRLARRSTDRQFWRAAEGRTLASVQTIDSCPNCGTTVTVTCNLPVEIRWDGPVDLTWFGEAHIVNSGQTINQLIVESGDVVVDFIEVRNGRSLRGDHYRVHRCNYQPSGPSHDRVALHPTPPGPTTAAHADD